MDKLCNCSKGKSKGNIWTKDNVPAGKLPPPLEKGTTSANIIQIGAGSSGSYSAALLGQTGCLKILIFDDGSEIDFNDSKFTPGIGGARFQPDIDKNVFPKYDFPGGYIALSNQKTIAWSVIRGGGMRLSNSAMEAGPSTIAKRDMFDALNQDPQWDPNYLWGHFMDNAFRFLGPNIEPNHANLGKVWMVESKESPFQNAWFNDASNVTSLPVVGDFNTLTGSIHTISGEPSNIKPKPPLDGTRSITENEYLLPEIEVNENITLIRDVKITRILFENYKNKQRAVGVEGLFHNQFFTLKFKNPNQKFKPGDKKDIRKKYHEIICSLGTIYNPYLLMLSGIGPENVLKENGIHIIKENSHVGKHYKDCSVAPMVFTINATREDIGLYDGPPSELIASRPGAFVNINGKEMFMLASPSDFGTTRGFVALSFELEQEREGDVVLTGANFSYDPLVYYNFDESTLQKHVDTFKLFREIINSNGMLQNEFSANEINPGPQVVTDEALRTAVRNVLIPTLHMAGTTRMALDETDGVVDREFRVFGVSGLRLSSLSILRFCPGAGGQFWAMAIAWNLNNAIRRYLGLSEL